MSEIYFELDCNTDMPHFHDEMEILFVLTGRMAVMQNGINFVLGMEDLIVFNSFEYHELYREPGGHTLSLFIPQSILSQVRIGQVICCSHIQPEREEHFRLLRARMAVVFKEYSRNTKKRASIILSEVFGMISIMEQYFSSEKVPEWRTNNETERMRDILIYVNRHYCEEISLKSVAEVFYLSTGHLSREFKKYIDLSFPDYIRKLRLNKAKYMLLHSSDSVTAIAFACGFSSVNTFIINFRQQSGLTPKEYKKHYTQSSHSDSVQEAAVSFMNLYKYIPYAESTQLLVMQRERPVRRKIDVRKSDGEVVLYHNEMLSVGWAKDLMLETMRDSVRRAKKEINFQYVYFHGILDDSLDVYHERPDGTPFLGFTYMDIILDFLMSIDIKPCMEFGYTPLKLVEQPANMFGPSCISLPTDLDKWGFVVEETMSHLISRYGIERVKEWKYSPSMAVYAFYNVFSLEEYLEYYDCTFRHIRKILPEAVIMGCMMDTSHIANDHGEMLIKWISYCKNHSCLPDEFSFQYFGVDYSKADALYAEQSIVSKEEEGFGEPVPVSMDPDLLSKEIKHIRRILKEQGAGSCPVILSGWNSTLWQSDLGNDTCFKAAFIVKNILENQC